MHVGFCAHISLYFLLASSTSTSVTHATFSASMRRPRNIRTTTSLSSFLYWEDMIGLIGAVRSPRLAARYVCKIIDFKLLCDPDHQCDLNNVLRIVS
jgi:hypothetical protein